MKYIGILILFLLSCNEEGNTEEKKDETPRVEVSINELREITLQDTLTFNARLIASKEIEIIAQVSGELKSIASNSSRIEKGKTALEINSEFYNSGYQMALASYKMAQLNAQKLEENIESYRELHKTGDISDDELKSYEIQYLSAKQQKWQSKNALDQAKVARDNAIYKVPFTGIFGNTNLVVGQQISTGQSLGKLANLDELKVNLSLSVEEISRVKRGYLAQFTTDGVSLKGEVKSISPVADTQTGTYLVEVIFPNTQEISVSGIFGKVQIFAQSYEDIFAVESQYLSSLLGRTYLNTVVSDSVVKVYVHTNMKLGKFSILSDSDKRGIKYITRANNKIIDGTLVKIVK